MTVKEGEFIPNGQERTRYFTGMLLTDEDLHVDQLFYRQRLQQISRLLFGCGVVCGLKVSPCVGSPMVSINPGVAFDSAGNLLELTGTTRVDLRDHCPPTPACKDEANTAALWIGLAFAARESRPTAVHVPGADAEHPPCETTRVREGVVVVVGTDEPPACECACIQPKPGETATTDGPATTAWAIPDACPDLCADGHPVVLARLTLRNDGSRCEVIDLKDERASAFSAALACARLMRPATGPSTEGAASSPATSGKPPSRGRRST